MKLKNLFFIILLIPFFSCNLNDKNKNNLNEIIVKDNKIPVINLELVPDSAKIINLSSIVSDIDIISLETKPECLINHAHPYYSDEILFVWTQSNMTVYLYEFDNSGKFIRQIGRPGKGPGEYNAWIISWLHAFEKEKQIGVYFDGYFGNPKIFQYDGQYLKDIKTPARMMGQPNKLNDSLWFNVGSITGNPEYKRDSLMLVIYKDDGTIVKEFPRKIYTKPQNGKYLPYGGNSSKYLFNGKWKIYNPGIDTLFYVEQNKLTPAAVVNRGKNGMSYHRNINPSELNGKYNFEIITETNEYLIIKKRVYTVSEMKELFLGEWDVVWNYTNFIIILDKKTGKFHNIRIKDDLLGFFPDKIFTNNFGQWSNGIYSYARYSSIIKEEIKEVLKKDNLPGNARERLTKLNNNLSENDNPVIFKFNLKEKFDLDE